MALSQRLDPLRGTEGRGEGGGALAGPVDGFPVPSPILFALLRSAQGRFGDLDA